MLGSKNQFSVLNINATDDQLGKVHLPSVRDAIASPSVSGRLQRDHPSEAIHPRSTGAVTL